MPMLTITSPVGGFITNPIQGVNVLHPAPAFGVTDDGQPFYQPEGPASGGDVLLGIDPDHGWPVLLIVEES